MPVNQRLRDAVVSRPALLDAIRSSRHRLARFAIVACGPFVLRQVLAERERVAEGGTPRPEEDRDLELYALRAACDRAVSRAEEERLLRLDAEARLAALGATPAP